MSEYIVLLDPSIRDNENNPSYNIGDYIIFKSVQKILGNIFPKITLKRISTHEWFGNKEKKLINDARFVFVGGSNILTSDIRHFSRLTPKKKNSFTFCPDLKTLFYWAPGGVATTRHRM